MRPTLSSHLHFVYVRDSPSNLAPVLRGTLRKKILLNAIDNSDAAAADPMRARVNDFYIPQAEPRKKKVCHINRGIFGRELRRRRFHRTQRLRTDAAKTGAVFRPIRREKPLNQGVLGLRRISSCVTRRLTAPDAQNLRSNSEFVELLRRTSLRLRAFPLAAVAASRSRESNRR